MKNQVVDMLMDEMAADSPGYIASMAMLVAIRSEKAARIAGMLSSYSREECAAAVDRLHRTGEDKYTAAAIDFINTHLLGRATA